MKSRQNALKSSHAILAFLTQKISKLEAHQIEPEPDGFFPIRAVCNALSTFDNIHLENMFNDTQESLDAIVNIVSEEEGCRVTIDDLIRNRANGGWYIHPLLMYKYLSSASPEFNCQTMRLFDKYCMQNERIRDEFLESMKGVDLVASINKTDTTAENPFFGEREYTYRRRCNYDVLGCIVAASRWFCMC